ncbi:Cobalt import ATP-binding protein CbiO [compost metagenome]
MGHLDLTATELSVRFGSRQVLQGASLIVPPGSRTALLGANGSGKTTLLRTLSGAQRPDVGEVLVGGVPLRYDRKGLIKHRQEVQLVLQDPDDQLFSADVRRDVSFGPLNTGLTECEVHDRVMEALNVLRIADLADRPTHQLSFGQRKRVAIAGALAMHPCLLLLDEPTAGLDPSGVDEMLEGLERLEKHGTTVVLATHDVDLALTWASQVAIVEGGTVTQGDPTDLLGNADLIARARLRRPWVLELTDRLDLTPSTDGLPRTLDALATAISRQMAGALRSPSESPLAGAKSTMTGRAAA